MDDVQQVRRFNRTVTQRIGALEDHYLARDRPLGASRVLWEVGDAGSDVRALRSRLDLDAGYLSRILSGFTASGLAAREKSQVDGRRQIVRLTEEGRRAVKRVRAQASRIFHQAFDGINATEMKYLNKVLQRISRNLDRTSGRAR